MTSLPWKWIVHLLSFAGSRCVPQIDRVTIHRRSVALRRPFVTAVRTALAVDALIVEVTDSDGRSGWGEAPTSWRVTGESAQSVTAAIEGPLVEAIMGRSSDEPTALSEALARATVRNSCARMSLDCALYDLAARHEGVPLFRYLGGRDAEVRTDMTLSATLARESIDVVVATALEHARAGFGTLKIKAGAGGDNVRTITGIREAVGPDIKLRVDANQGWTRHEAIRIISELHDAGADIEVVEQPVDRDDIESLAFITDHVPTPIMADESVWTRRQLREILGRRAADLVNVKLAKTGGIREALAVIQLARENEIGVIIGCMSESHVAIAAGAALASAVDARAIAGPTAHDLDGGLWLTSSPVEGGVAYDGERLLLTTEPGTGIVRIVGDI